MERVPALFGKLGVTVELQETLGGPHIAVLLNQKSFLSPEDICQCLESFWMVTISAGEKG